MRSWDPFVGAGAFGLALALGLAVGSCGSNARDSGPSSETHWLSLCKKDSDCAQGQSCLCGQCTTACAANGCAQGTSCLHVASCAPAGACLMPCDHPLACGSNLTCRELACVAEPTLDASVIEPGADAQSDISTNSTADRASPLVADSSLSPQVDGAPQEASIDALPPSLDAQEASATIDADAMADSSDHPCPNAPLGCWRPMTSVGAPDARWYASTVWTGSEVVLWGGWTRADSSRYDNLNRGARYDPIADRWTSMSRANDPSLVGRARAGAMWLDNLDVGGRLWIWGGAVTLGDESPDYRLATQLLMYNPALDAWDPRGAEGAPPGRAAPGVVWTGSRVIVWGGDGTTDIASDPRGPVEGGMYDPTTGQWTAMSTVGAPSPREDHAMVWTGDRLLVWGGVRDPGVSGASFDPIANTWAPISQNGEPALGRTDSVYFGWTGSELVVWNGKGGRYNPKTDTWQPMSTAGGPTLRSEASFVWTGTHLLIWGGRSAEGGARYDATRDRWEPLPTEGAPSARLAAATTWTGRGMVVWGGWASSSSILDDGAIYYPPPTQ